MTILEAAKKLDASLFNPTCPVWVDGKTVCETAQVPLDKLIGRKLEISNTNGQFVIDFTALLFLSATASDPDAGKYVRKPIMRVATKPYQGIVAPIVKMSEILL